MGLVPFDAGRSRLRVELLGIFSPRTPVSKSTKIVNILHFTSDQCTTEHLLRKFGTLPEDATRGGPLHAPWSFLMFFNVFEIPVNKKIPEIPYLQPDHPHPADPQMVHSSHQDWRIPRATRPALEPSLRPASRRWPLICLQRKADWPTRLVALKLEVP